MSLLGGIFKNADEAAQSGAKAADESKTLADEFVSNDEAARHFGSEATDGINSGGSYTEDSFLKRRFANLSETAVEGSTPSAVVDAGTSNIADAGKWLGGGAAAGTGLWAGSEMYGDYTALKTAESKEAAYEEYQAALEKIRNNENLTPDQKEEAIARLREAYQLAIENSENGGANGPLADLFGDLLGGMSIPDKLLVGVALVVIVMLAQQNMGGA